MRVLSGIQPSADSLHLGNYFGALRQFVALQEQHEMLLFIADYHSMNSVRDGKQRRANTLAEPGGQAPVSSSQITSHVEPFQATLGLRILRLPEAITIGVGSSGAPEELTR